MASQLSYVDLFAGCGGLSLGLHQAGLKGIFAIEKSPDAFKTLKFNLIDNHRHFAWPDWLPMQSWEIKEFIKNKETELRNLKGKVDLVVGGPPCQGFSTAGLRVENDDRNSLIHSYLDFVEMVEPRVIIFENVRGFTAKFSKSEKPNHVPYSDIVLGKLNELGYTDAIGRMINMSNYGVPQSRKRYIVIATRMDLAGKIFTELENGRKAFLESKGLPLKNSARDVLSDLEYKHGTVDSPDTKGFKAGIISDPQTELQKTLRKDGEARYVPDSHRFVNHTAKAGRVFQYLLDNAPRNKCLLGEERAQYHVKKRNVTVLDKKEPAPTVTTIPDDFVHYSEPRVMTVRECARIQTFPDWFEFKGPYTTGGKMRTKSAPRYTQVGNAVPPLFAEQLGLAVRKILENG